MNTGLIEQLEVYAAELRAELEGHNAEARAESGRRRGTVHAVGSTTWIGGVEVPAPKCHTGFTGGELGALTPTYRAVNCLKCLRSLGVASAQPLPDPAQPALF